MKLLRFLLAFCLLAVGCSACSLSAHHVTPPRPADPIGEMRQATALLVGRGDDGHVEALCSGVWVGQVDLVTAAHGVDLASDPAPGVGSEIEFVGEEAAGQDPYADKLATRKAIVVAVDRASDLALLSGPRTGHGVAQVFRGAIRQGDAVRTMGHTFGLPWSLSLGMVGADRQMRPRGSLMHVLQIVSGANHGDSGGGVWTEGGELLGIGSFRLEEDGSILLFYTHRDSLLAMLVTEDVLAY